MPCIVHTCMSFCLNLDAWWFTLIYFLHYVPYTIDSKGNLSSHALVQYHFQGEEHSIFVWPHGNAKKSESYVHTMPSTLEILDNVSTEQTPKLSVHIVFSQLGGVIDVLPRNQQQQAKDKRRKSNAQSSDPFSQRWWCVNNQWRDSCKMWCAMVVLHEVHVELMRDQHCLTTLFLQGSNFDSY